MGEDVLERRHPHPHRVYLELLGAVKGLVVDRATLRVEDQVDQDIPVVGFQEPALRRRFNSQPRMFECPLGPLGVSRPDEEVDVVLGLRAAARPARETSTEQVWNARFLQGPARNLHRAE